MCCIDNTPKNTESYFIGKTLKWLKRNTGIKKVITYADETYNHKGIIYQATNFKYLGMTPPGKIIIYKGKQYHDRAIRQKYKRVLKSFAKELKEALKNNEAYYKTTKGKNIYIYTLR